MPDETVIVTGPQDMQLNNRALHSHASNIELVGTEQLNMEQRTNPQYSVFESQRRSSQQEYVEQNSAQYSRLPLTEKHKEQNEEKVIRMDPLELADDSGASESSEGILDHNPFTSI